MFRSMSLAAPFRMIASLALVSSLCPSPAQAGFPDDVSVLRLGEWNGQEVTNTSTTRVAYQTVVRELAATIANKHLSPAETLGVAGFDLALTNNVGFIRHDSDSNAAPSPWERVHEDGDPTGVMWVPGVSMRKGLPLSLEAGVNAGYISFSRQSTLGAYGRWGIIEGYRSYPDLSMQIGYASYLGNPELQVGVMDLSGTIGYTIPFGTRSGINHAQFSPYAGAGVLRINASPNINATAQESLGVARVSSFPEKSANGEATPGFTPVEIHAGFRILSGDVQVLVAGSYAVGLIPSLSTGVGYVF